MAGDRFPRWLSGHLKTEDVGRIVDAIQKAEAQGDLEVVPLIVRRSSVIGQVPIVLTLLLSTLGFLVLLALRDHFHDVALIIAVFAWLPVSAVLGWGLSGIAMLQRLSIPDADEELQVRRRASAEFALQRIARTRGRTGLLIFISVMERRAVILPDETLQPVLTREVCEKLVARMTAHLHAGRWGDAFVDVIREAGQAVAAVMPRPAGHRDELDNRLSIKE